MRPKGNRYAMYIRVSMGIHGPKGLYTQLLFHSVMYQSTGVSPSPTINRIVSVCLFVCLSVRYLLLENLWYIAILYMDRSEIYQGVFLSMFRVDPTNFPDAIGVKLEKLPKMDIFWRFFEILRGLLMKCVHILLIEDRRE